ncbi:ImmA/IrrE family metallo-endopeptidase [Paenibacillus sp. N1-5-1-14]|uniref:ImmA/IrrE family metallo-endopeptidase n=1 Tax=Paenibacillus radicibacter TaxID=2972488 RepID=UPI002159506D|nr:ImmA/IrrE family metallo-endopeptidase [Paenibacillus radicibacter]MCR8645558.1 ImmA/IrrE family metallo-endopeptidase [Paenibacillus radicibacter]
MQRHYRLTPLEHWVEDMYKRIHITQPSQLDILEIAQRLNIWVYFMEMGSQAIDRNGVYSICVDRRITPQEQWEDFLHELCHVLRHSGNQVEMSEDFMDKQELEANTFQLYAAIPYSMFRQLELPQTQQEIIDLIATEFRVTHALAQRRLEQIQRRVLQGILDQEVRNKFNSDMQKYDAANWSASTHIIMNQLSDQLRRKGAN